MKCELKWMLAAILICGMTTALTSCVGQNDNPVTTKPEGGTVDNDLAVKCINGTFIGKKTDNVPAMLS